MGSFDAMRFQTVNRRAAPRCICSRSTGLAPVAGTIGWLTPRRRRFLLRRARPGGKHDLCGSSRPRGAGQSCARPGQARHGARCPESSSCSQSITARQVHAPDVKEQKRNHLRFNRGKRTCAATHTVHFLFSVSITGGGAASLRVDRGVSAARPCDKLGTEKRKRKRTGVERLYDTVRSPLAACRVMLVGESPSSPCRASRAREAPERRSTCPRCLNPRQCPANECHNRRPLPS